MVGQILTVLIQTRMGTVELAPGLIPGPKVHYESTKLDVILKSNEESYRDISIYTFFSSIVAIKTSKYITKTK